MSKPWVHAESSARKFGGQPEHYLALHDLMDSSKAHLGDARHRAIFHSREGIELALMVAKASGLLKKIPTLANLYVPALACVQHVEEDLGFVPAASEWARAASSRIHDDSGYRAEMSAQQHGGEPEDYGKLHSFLDCRPEFMLHNTLGPFLAEAAFGTFIVNSEGKDVGVRDLVEDHIMRQHGRLPSVQDVLGHVELKPWMSGAKKAQYVLVD